MGQVRPTFRQILDGIEKSNSEKLMRRARRANRIAKATRGRARRRAYVVKAKALSFLVKNLPGRTRIHSDLVLADFVIVKVKGIPSGLHMPISTLEGGAA